MTPLTLIAAGLLFLLPQSKFAVTASTDCAVTDTVTVPQASATDQMTLERTRKLVEEIRAASFPELSGVIIKVELLQHEADFFRSRFTFLPFLTGRQMQYVLKVNPAVYARNVPEAGVRAIIAHELAHVVWYRQRKRIRLFGLACLLSEKYSARFERRTDLLAVERGYGAGLKEYRNWLYQQIPARKMAEKRRNYFSPEEVDAILARTQERPELFAWWARYVPLSLAEILARPAAARP